jgi:hypothetical protein
MSDPLSMAAVNALGQAVTFVFTQLTDLLRRRRERKDRADAAASIDLPEVPAGVLDGALPAATAEPTTLDQLAPEIAEVRIGLETYSAGITPVSEGDPQLADLVAKARDLLELAYGKHVTFTGETGRPTTGTDLPDDEHRARLVAISASGTGAVAAHTIDGPVATTGGIAADTITGNVSTGGWKPTGGSGDDRDRP